MNGLDEQPLAQIAAQVPKLGFNCVRLPFSAEMVLNSSLEVPRPELTLRANAELQRKSALQVFDAVVEALTSIGVLVFLNQHVSAAGWCCSGSDGEGLWYTKRFPEEAWLDSLGAMAERYKRNPWVVGVDLRNEVRPNGNIIPSWGTNDPATDWALASIRGAKRVLASDSDLLIAISGIMYGVRMVDVKDRPVHVTEPELRNRTIYSTHYYYGWCFDLVAKDYLLREERHVLLFAFWLWLLTAADFYLAERPRRRLRLRGATASAAASAGAPAGAALWGTKGGGLGGDGGGPLEEALARLRIFLAAVLAVPGRFCRGLLALRPEVSASIFFLSLIGPLLLAGRRLERSCGHIHIMSPPAFAVITYIVFKVSYVLWAWILFAYTVALFLRDDAEDALMSYALEELEEVKLATGFLHRSASGGALGATGGGDQCRDFASRASSSKRRSRSTESFDAEDSDEGGENASMSSSSSDWDVGKGTLIQRVLRICSGVCGPHAFLRLAQPLREHKRACLLGPALLLVAMHVLAIDFGSYEAFSRDLDVCWGFLLRGDGVEPAPVWLSEFGTEDLDLYWSHLMRFMRENQVDFAYWSLNGEEAYGMDEEYGILRPDSATVRNPRLLSMLQSTVDGAGEGVAGVLEAAASALL